MSFNQLARRTFLGAMAASMSGTLLFGEEPRFREPIYRVANAAGTTPQAGAHPLDPAIEFAKEGLARIRADVHDYTGTIIKRERIKGVLGDYEYMFAKIRNRKVENDQIVTPFGVYLTFLKPEAVKGREVIWVEGQNNGKMKAHEGSGFVGKLPSVWLDPHGHFAMKGQLYPITEIGLENLVAKLVEKGERDKQYQECEVEFIKGAKINGRQCTLLQVKHPVMREHFEFHLAQIFIDDEIQLPVRYVAYHWPSKEGGAPPVMEEYTYVNLKVNVGLTDKDFDPENPEYRF